MTQNLFVITVQLLLIENTFKSENISPLSK